MRLAAAEKVSLRYGLSKMFWPNETVWRVTAATEAAT